MAASRQVAAEDHVVRSRTAPTRSNHEIIDAVAVDIACRVNRDASVGIGRGPIDRESACAVERRGIEIDPSVRGAVGGIERDQLVVPAKEHVDLPGIGQVVRIREIAPRGPGPECRHR